MVVNNNLRPCFGALFLNSGSLRKGHRYLDKDFGPKHEEKKFLSEITSAKADNSKPNIKHLYTYTID